MMEFKYLHKVGQHTWWLDHRLTPETRAMLCAMTSRMPVGGMPERYAQVIDAVAEDLYDNEPEDMEAEEPAGDRIPWSHIPDILKDHPPEDTQYLRGIYESFCEKAEDRLCEYPLHDKVLGFFNQFVRSYGHSSVLELTGSPAVYSGNLSWWTAWLLFDTPLVSGQENSTRAVTRKDWPVCREAYEVDRDSPEFLASLSTPVREQEVRANIPNRVHPMLKEIHETGMAIANAEIAAWKAEFESPCDFCGGDARVKVEDHGKHSDEDCPFCDGTGKKYPSLDKQAFRPALDRARWALPGTISTGVAYTSYVRDRARAIQDALAFYKGSPEGIETIKEIQQAYQESVPGIGDLGLKEAWYEAPGELSLPFHLDEIGTMMVFPRGVQIQVQDDPSWYDRVATEDQPIPCRRQARTYADPILNELRVRVAIPCSLAVTRDWHRHRTLYPLQFRLAQDDMENFVLDPHYEARSELGKAQWKGYFSMCRDAFEHFVEEGDMGKAMLCLPFGAQVELTGECGLRDFLYIMELRGYATGANFEYQEQAREAIRQLRQQLPSWIVEALKIPDPDKE